MVSPQNQSIWLRWINQSVRQAGWAPAGVFAVHVVLLGGFDAYTLLPSLDMLMHFIGGVVMAFFIHRTSLNASRLGVIGPHHPVTHWLLVFSATCAVAMFWEFAEFALDQILGTHSQPSLDDTMSDLVFGTIGAGVLMFVTAVYDRCSQPALSRAVRETPNIKTALPGD
jgi:hypothetical protein